MKRILLTTFLLTIITAGCGENNKTKTDDQIEKARAMQNENDILCRQAAEKLTAIFGGELKAELTKALGEGGAVKAIDVCRLKAPKISQIFSINGVKIKRVAERYRNLDNRATVEQLQILAQFADRATAPEYIGQWIRTDSIETYHFYKPIYTEPFCLNCHGGLQTLAPGVIDAVRRNYPNDKATGFKAGELRGMFIVEIDWPEGRGYAEEIVDFQM